MQALPHSAVPSVPARVAVLDRFASFAEAIARVLDTEPDLEVVGVEHSARAALEHFPAVLPDVVLCDVRLADMGGASFIARLRAALPDAKILVVTSSAEPAMLATALQCGANGFLSKSTGIGEIVDAARRVLAGETVTSPHLLTATVEHLRRNSLPRLSGRELEVVELAAEGLSTTAIAQRLGLRPNTARNHLQRSFEKLGVHSRLEAVMAAQRTGLVGLAS